MGITKLSKSGFTSSSYEKYNDFLAGNTAFSPSSYESIATVTVGSGGSATVEFTSIPATYTHLQIRSLVQTNRSSYVVDQFSWRFNDDTASNYSSHYIRGGYESTPNVVSSGGASQTRITYPAINSGVAAAVFSASIMDILDYANTNKYKTTRELSGFDVNGTAGTGSYGGTVTLGSGNWRSTSAITKITITMIDGTLFNQYSQFALYGIKGA